MNEASQILTRNSTFRLLHVETAAIKNFRQEKAGCFIETSYAGSLTTWVTRCYRQRTRSRPKASAQLEGRCAQTTLSLRGGKNRTSALQAGRQLHPVQQIADVVQNVIGVVFSTSRHVFLHELCKSIELRTISFLNL